MDLLPQYDGPGKNGPLGEYMDMIRDAINNRTPMDGTNTSVTESPGEGFSYDVTITDPALIGLETYDADVCDGDEVVTKTFYVAA